MWKFKKYLYLFAAMLPVPVQRIDFRVGNLEILEDGVLYYHLFDDSVLDISDVQEMLKAHSILAARKPRLVLVDAGVRTSMTPEARLFDISRERQKYTLAEAVIVNNIVTRITANFYYRFNPPPYKTRFFNSEESAYAWLKSMEKVAP